MLRALLFSALLGVVPGAAGGEGPPVRLIVHVTPETAAVLADEARGGALLAEWSRAAGVELRPVRRFRENAWILALAGPAPEGLAVLLETLRAQPGITDVEHDALLRPGG